MEKLRFIGILAYPKIGQTVWGYPTSSYLTHSDVEIFCINHFDVLVFFPTD